MTVERQISVTCKPCNAEMICPCGKDCWAWLKCGDVIDFYAAHRNHGRFVGAEVRYIEKEEE